MGYFVKIRTTLAAAAVLVGIASAASAVTMPVLSLTAGTGCGGTPDKLPSNFDANAMGGPGPLPAVGDTITCFTGSDPFSGGTTGLSISGTSAIKLTYIGSEASASNKAISFGGMSLSNSDAVGTSIIGNQPGPGMVNFIFKTVALPWENWSGERSITNGVGTTFAGLKMGFGAIFNNGRSILAFFGDGRGDADFDDLVIRIDVVPLPASILLMLGALGGLGVMRRRRSATA